MGISKIIIYTLLFISLAITALAQKSNLTQQNYEQKRKIEQEKIETAQRLLTQTQSEKEVTIGQVKAIGESIKSREKLIALISKEIKFLQSEITESDIIVTSLEKDLKALREEYGEMIYSAYKSQNKYQKLVFLFSAKTVNQFRMRLKYLQQYSEARKTQAQQIQKIQSILNDQIQKLNTRKNQKVKLLALELFEKTNLKVSMDLKDKMVVELKGKEKKLKSEIKQRELTIKKLDKLINDIIQAELKKKQLKEKTIGRTPEYEKVSSAFAANKTKMIWPVANGFISKDFGIHPHPIFPEVSVENNGVDIQTYKDEVVRTVHKGKVITVASVPGMQNIVMIEHGEFYTVYANLVNTTVKAGQDVNFKDQIGTVYTDKDGVSELQFQLWKGKTKLDPQEWLYVK